MQEHNLGSFMKNRYTYATISENEAISPLKFAWLYTFYFYLFSTLIGLVIMLFLQLLGLNSSLQSLSGINACINTGIGVGGAMTAAYLVCKRFHKKLARNLAKTEYKRLIIQSTLTTTIIFAIISIIVFGFFVFPINKFSLAAIIICVIVVSFYYLFNLLLAALSYYTACDLLWQNNNKGRAGVQTAGY